MRKGTLTDAETLRMYESGVNIIAICVKEGMTVYGVISRLGRARKVRNMKVVGRRRPTKQATELIDTFEALKTAVARLERMVA